MSYDYPLHPLAEPQPAHHVVHFLFRDRRPRVLGPRGRRPAGPSGASGASRAVQLAPHGPRAGQYRRSQPGQFALPATGGHRDRGHGPARAAQGAATQQMPRKLSSRSCATPRSRTAASSARSAFGLVNVRAVRGRSPCARTCSTAPGSPKARIALPAAVLYAGIRPPTREGTVVASEPPIRSRQTTSAPSSTDRCTSCPVRSCRACNRGGRPGAAGCGGRPARRVPACACPSGSPGPRGPASAAAPAGRGSGARRSAGCRTGVRPR